MASPNVYGRGLNLTGTVFQNGPNLLTLYPAWLSGAVQWVDTIGGNNANAGTDPELPVQTLAQAVTNSSASGLIVIGEGSTESPSVSQSIALAGLRIVGCGAGSTRPRYTCTGAVSMWDVTAAGVRIQNIYFPASTAAATNRVALTGINGEVRDCYFECGASDTNRAVRVHTGAHGTRVSSCTFIATASRPAIGLEVSAAVTDTSVVDTTFDGGSVGWTDYAFKVSAAATRINIENVSLLNRSDFGATVTGTTYQAFGLTNDGLNRVLWTA